MCSQSETIPVIPGLKELRCYKCPLIKTIPVIQGLELLICSGCPLLEIPKEYILMKNTNKTGFTLRM